MKILSDIGGTYVRFATHEGGRPENIRKYEAADFPDFSAALVFYVKEIGISGQHSLRIASAAHQRDGVWRFTNKNTWVMDLNVLSEQGWRTEVILNDFEAATWGLLSLGNDELDALRAGKAQEDQPRCLLGPGTGLGLGYLIPLHDGGYHVQKTQGGHMPVVCMTEEQWLVCQMLKRVTKDPVVPVFENFVSGAGLLNIYQALCLINGKTPAAESPEGVMALDSGVEKQDALRLFHEFMGLFAAHIMVTSRSYGGVYLTGGVLDRLAEHGAFDRGAFLRAMDLPFVEGIKHNIDAVPIYHVCEPYLALRGLAYEDLPHA